MFGIKGFILGFCFSLSCFALCGHTHSRTSLVNQKTFNKEVKINLFRATDTASHTFATNNLFAHIEKTSLITADTPYASLRDVEGVDDDEIISVNIDGRIPIEFSSSDDIPLQTEIIFGNAENTNQEDEVAMLSDEILNEKKRNEENPWVEVKGVSNIRNKRLLEDIKSTKEKNLFTENIQHITQNDEAVSYKVAEKIKQSIIFPIPNEILNDENLTPTFIKNSFDNKKENKNKTPSVVARESSLKRTEDVIQIPTVPHEDKTEADKNKDKGIINSITDWLSEKTGNSQTQPVSDTPKKQTPPSYSTPKQKVEKITPKTTKTDDFASFYETLQNTKQEYAQRKILPSELKLSFQPNRAEISGTTLNWLKTFSEATQDENTYLKIYLDALTSTELQKKRLNLLYTIFMNNGVNFKKIDTVFSSTEPNAFVIRVVKLK